MLQIRPNIAGSDSQHSAMEDWLNSASLPLNPKNLKHMEDVFKVQSVYFADAMLLQANAVKPSHVQRFASKLFSLQQLDQFKIASNKNMKTGTGIKKFREKTQNRRRIFTDNGSVE
jgi:hypothetical protein